MEILQNIIYVFFFIQVIRWVITFIALARMSNLELHYTKLKPDLSDNILWIAPVIYFSGGLV